LKEKLREMKICLDCDNTFNNFEKSVTRRAQINILTKQSSGLSNRTNKFANTEIEIDRVSTSTNPRPPTPTPKANHSASKITETEITSPLFQGKRLNDAYANSDGKPKRI